MIHKIIFPFLIFVPLLACESTNDTASNGDNIILEVSQYAVTLNNKPASYIKFGLNDANHCNLAVLKASTVKGYKLEIQGSSSLDVEVDITCMQNNNFYSMSAKSDTSIQINTIDATDTKVVYKLDSKLISAQDKSYYELKDVILNLEGNNFKILVQ